MLLTSRCQRDVLQSAIMDLSLTTRCLRALCAVLWLLIAVPSPAAQFTAMQKFVLIFRQGPHPLTDADKARRQIAISAWAKTQNAAGHKLEPRPLASEIMRPGLAASSAAVGTWPITALVFLEARDLAEASQIAAAHPAKDFNTGVEVRPWAPPAVSLATTKAAGPFDVKMTSASAPDAATSRFTLDKHYHGDLEANATGEMLATMTATKGSAGYVAVEKVTGSLAGRTGSFHLQHTGTMNRGAPSLTITVVPDSGTGELTGLTGTMSISITPDGAHTYEFDYTLPGKT
jgi:hypothetical protein